MSRIKKHSGQLSHYLPLLGIFAFGIISFWSFSYDRFFQTSTAVAVALAYVIWGIVHHHMHNDLHWKIVIEYMGIAIVGLAIILSLVLRA